MTIPANMRSPAQRTRAAARRHCPNEFAFWLNVRESLGLEVPIARVVNFPWRSLGLPADTIDARASASVLAFPRPHTPA